MFIQDGCGAVWPRWLEFYRILKSWRRNQAFVNGVTVIPKVGILSLSLDLIDAGLGIYWGDWMQLGNRSRREEAPRKSGWRWGRMLCSCGFDFPV